MMGEFMKATAIRCARTFFTTLLACIGEGTLITEVDWQKAFLISASATLFIFITCIVGGLPEVKSANELLEDEVDDDDVEVTGYDRVGDSDDVE